MIFLGVPNITTYDIALIISFLIIILGVIIAGVCIILRALNLIHFTYSKIGKTFFVLSIMPVILIWLLASLSSLLDWYNNSPTNVSKDKLKGLYEIDTGA